MVEGNGRRRVQFWAGMLLSIASLAAIFLLIDPAEIAAALRSADYGYVSLSLLGIVAFLLLRAVRWRFMLDNEVAWGPVFHIQNIGYLITYILPFRIGDVARAVLIGNVPPVTLARGLSTVVVERVLDMLFIVTLLPFTLAAVETVPPAVQAAARISGIVAVAAIAVLVVAANRRAFAHRLATFFLQRVRRLDTDIWVRRTDELLEGLNSLTRRKDGLILAGLSLLVWLPIIFAYYTSLLAVHLQPTVAMAGFVVCAAALSISAPSSPGQVGVFHAGVTFALVQVLDQPEAPAATFAFLYHALNFFIVIVLGLAGVYSIGATLGNVVASTRALLQQERPAARSGDRPQH